MTLTCGAEQVWALFPFVLSRMTAAIDSVEGKQWTGPVEGRDANGSCLSRSSLPELYEAMRDFGLVPKVIRTEMAVCPGKGSRSQGQIGATRVSIAAAEGEGGLLLTIRLIGPSQVIVHGLKAAAVRALDVVRASEMFALPVAAGAESVSLPVIPMRLGQSLVSVPTGRAGPTRGRRVFGDVRWWVCALLGSPVLAAIVHNIWGQST